MDKVVVGLKQGSCMITDFKGFLYFNGTQEGRKILSNKPKRVYEYDKNMNFVTEHESISAAGRATRLGFSLVRDSLHNKSKHKEHFFFFEKQN